MPLHLTQHLRNELHLTPQLLQSMKILQMNTDELISYLKEAVNENPVLEYADDGALPAEFAALKERFSWIDTSPVSATFRHEDAERPEYGREDLRNETLLAFLLDQLGRLKLPKPAAAAAEYLARLIDDDGYIDQDDIDATVEMGVPGELAEEALSILQSLDPPGVGARTLSECLLLQLDRRGVNDPAAEAIIWNCLPELGKKQYAAIGRKLSLSEAEIRAAEKTIVSLDPKPCSAFETQETAVYVRPDIYVVEENGVLTAIVNEYSLPRVGLSSYYENLAKEADDETRKWLKERMHGAKDLLDSLSRRKSTISRCADALIQIQQAFFLEKSPDPVPMRLTDLADLLGIHPTTVHRALRDKYLQCRQGVYPLSFFFSRSVSGRSRIAVKRQLALLIRDEDPEKPLSDRKLSELLSGGGVTVAVRTVAKYRAELGIAGSFARKRRE